MNLGSRQLLIDHHITFPEGPRWREGRLWFSDMMAGRVMKTDIDGNLELVAEYDGWLSGLGWLPDGSLIVVAMTERKLLKLEHGKLVEIADLSAVTAMHSNDMVVAADGRAYIGEVGFDIRGGAAFKEANLVTVVAEAEPVVAAANLACPNGIVITPKGDTLIVAETLAERLTAFSVATDGSLCDKRIWADITGLQPDGICLDAEGAIWVACPFAGTVIRVLEGGNITHRFETDLLPLACMLGGPDGDLLFICQALNPDEALQSMSGGRIEMVRVDSPGAGLP